MKFDIITFGSATQDIILKPQQVTLLRYGKNTTDGKEVCFPMGSKINIEDMQFESGGGGTNVAATFALQGFKTAFCGTVGTDVAGQEVISELKKLKIHTGFVKKTDKKRTNHSVVILQGKQDRTILVYRGASELMAKEDIPWNKLKAKWLYLAPLSGALCSAFSDIVDFAKNNDIKIAANPSMAQLSLADFSEIASKIDILILNQEEASFLTKVSYKNEKGVFEKMDALHPGITIMTRGAEGVMVSDGKNIYTAMPPADRNIVDTTGAGDAFGSGFVSEFMRSGDIEKSIQLGMGNSVGNLAQVGAKTGLLKKGQEFTKVKVNRG